MIRVGCGYARSDASPPRRRPPETPRTATRGASRAARKTSRRAVSRRSPSWCTKKPLARRRSRFGARVKGRASAPEDAFPSSKKADRTLTRNIDNGIDFNILKEKINTSIAWEQLTRGLFLHTISISELEVKELLRNDDSLSPELAKRILINKQVRLKSEKYLRDLRSEANIEER